MPVALRYAARSDVGLGRYTNNQDSGYAGPHLLAVCDGMGGHAGGDVASSVALGRLVALDGDSYGGEALRRLADALRDANAEIARQAREDPQLAGMGTTATVLMRYDRKLALAHIGDSRGYLLRDGQLSRITRDHTFVQSLVDEGRISVDEAEQHPQRNIVTRVLSGDPDDEPDVSAREARVGDRYLLCSDGLTGVVSEETIAETLTAGDDPAATAEALISMALRGGAPDNVTVVVAQVVDSGDPRATVVPEVVGSAAVHGTVPTAAPASTPAAKAAALARAQHQHTAEGDDDGIVVGPPASPRRWVARALATAVALVVLAVGAYAAWAWSQQQYFVGADGSDVAIYRGLPQDIGPVSMSKVYERQDLALAQLPEYSQQQVRSTITADDLADARAKVGALRSQAVACSGTTPRPLATTARPSASPSAGQPASGTTSVPTNTAPSRPAPNSSTPTTPAPAAPDAGCAGAVS
ncbi:MAG TPA: PP2C family serine/threonine-protein phosphatase [Actinomycetales bacterium]|nr:PP2C family serine/threonine-protein phosphatase [Actinomycetales bacterium]